MLTAVRETPDEVDEKLGQLKTRLAVAERSLAADLSDDWATFADAVEEELRSWDTYLERLQATAAMRPWKAREPAEAAIADLRDRRLAVDERLDRRAPPRSRPGRSSATYVETARDELERKADELTLDPRRCRKVGVAAIAGQRGTAILPEPNPALVRQAKERAQSIQNRIADRITAFAGSMRFVYIHIAWFGCWIGFGVERYPYGLLTMIVSLEAIFLSTFVMISQNRADAKRQVIADQQWETVQEEDRQNEELLALSRQILELTEAISPAPREAPTRKEAGEDRREV